MMTVHRSFFRSARIAMIATGAVLLLCGTLSERAVAQPAQRPEMGPARPDRWERERPERSERAERRPWDRQISAEEQERALEFAAKHMPNLYEAIEEAEKGSLPQRRMVRFAVDRYRWAQRLERDDADRYDQMLLRLQSQDEIFALLSQLRSAPSDQQTEIRSQLRVKVREMVLDFIQERQRRIEHLKRMLQREEQELERDRQNVETLTDQRLSKLLDEMREVSPEDDAAESSIAPTTAPGEPGAR